MTHDLTSILAAIPLFKPLEPKEVAALVQLFALQKFSANQPLLVEGQPPPGLYIVLDGRVTVCRRQGARVDHICDLDAGECVGELEIIERAPCSASVVAAGEVETAVIVPENLQRYFVAFPAAAVKILRQMVTVLAGRLRQTNVSYSSLKSIADSMMDE
jgi:CRP-like cAMP-binding protein